MASSQVDGSSPPPYPWRSKCVAHSSGYTSHSGAPAHPDAAAALRPITPMRADARPRRYFIQRFNNVSLTTRLHHARNPSNAQDTRHHAHPRPGDAMTGMNRSSILRAIKRGALTGTKDHNDVWHVDGAELARVFPVNTQLAPQDTHPDALAAHKLALAEERITELKERLEEMRQECDRARASEDAWKTQARPLRANLPLPAPYHAQAAQQPEQPAEQPSRFRRAWRWMRATG
jgi:hypothetical protein